jgi:hypothetical protein
MLTMLCPGAVSACPWGRLSLMKLQCLAEFQEARDVAVRADVLDDDVRCVAPAADGDDSALDTPGSAYSMTRTGIGL